MSFSKSNEVSESLSNKGNKSKMKLFIIIIFLITLIASIFLTYLYFIKRDNNINTSQENTYLEQKDFIKKIAEKLYNNEGFNKVVVYDEVWPGYFLRGYTDGEIIEDEIDIPGINYKNKLAFRLYYLDKNFAIKSIIIPLIGSNESGEWKVLDQASEIGFKERGIEKNEEKYKYFTENIVNKKNKILTVSLRPDRETVADEDLQSDIWNEYYSVNKEIYNKFINMGNDSIGIIIPRSLTSDFTNDRFI